MRWPHRRRQDDDEERGDGSSRERLHDDVGLIISLFCGVERDRDRDRKRARVCVFVFAVFRFVCEMSDEVCNPVVPGELPLDFQRAAAAMWGLAWICLLAVPFYVCIIVSFSLPRFDAWHLIRANVVGSIGILTIIIRMQRLGGQL
jgi:hypothetical protein